MGRRGGVVNAIGRRNQTKHPKGKDQSNRGDEPEFKNSSPEIRSGQKKRRQPGGRREDKPMGSSFNIRLTRVLGKSRGERKKTRDEYGNN